MSEAASIAAAPRRPENSIGLLRVVLAGAVLWGHSWYLAGREHEEPIARWLLGNGEAIATFAVKGFFVLSGYLVFQSEQRLDSTRRFLWHRLLRIYPGLWICLGLSGLVIPAAFGSFVHGGALWSDAARYIGGNLVLVRSVVGIPHLFENAPRPGDLNGSLWTLPYELGCYAALALLGWLGATRTRTRRPWFAGAAIYALYLHDLLGPNGAIFFKTEGRALAIWFVFGALAACLPAAMLRRMLDWRAALLAALAYIMSCHLGGLAIVGPFSISALVLALAFTLPLRDFEQRVGGDYSYGIYIYAYPLQQALASNGMLKLGMGAYIASVAIATLVFAFASWHLVEKRALTWKSLGSSVRAPLRNPAHA